MEKSCTMRVNHRDFIRELISVLSWFELTIYEKTVNLFQGNTIEEGTVKKSPLERGFRGVLQWGQKR
jgi:hypothetical protein